MSFYSQWQEILGDGGSAPDAQEAIQKYYELEKDAYEKILLENTSELHGTAAELADRLGFGKDMVTFIGFLDGINSSLKSSLDLEPVDEGSELSLEIDFRRLYWQMHEAKADWLFGLKAWNQILTPEEQQELTREYRTSKIIRREKIGRNDPCPCGSGKKYKNCCGKGATA